MSKNILYAMAYLHIVGGLLLPFITQIEWASHFISRSLAETPAQAGAVFWLGVFGPTVASWGVLFLCLLNIYFAQPSIQVWRTLLVAVLVWGVTDTCYCLLNGIPQALLTNIPALLLLLVPLYWVHPKHMIKVLT